MTHYTYAHVTADTNDVFYIGKGQGRRAWSRSSRTAYWKHIADKHGFHVIVVRFWNTEAEALSHEMELIANCRSQGARICNLTDGGEGGNGLIHSESTKAAISKAMSGRSVSEETRKKLSRLMSGKKMSKEHCQKISEAMRGIAGHKQTDATRAKISAAKTGKTYGKQSEETKRKRSESMKLAIAKKRAAGIALKIPKVDWTEERRQSMSTKIAHHWATVRNLQRGLA